MQADTGTPLKVGLMVPINNTTMEGEILAWLPPGSSCVTKRIPRGQGLLTAETISAYLDKALALAAEFPNDIDVVAYGCTAAGFIAGPEGEGRLAEQLADITGKPVVTTARSMVSVLQSIGARNIALVTPYSDAVNQALTRFLTDGDIAVNRLSTFNAPDVDALGRITAEEVDQRARSTMHADCDALFIACSQLPTQKILAPLEHDLTRPAWSSIRATAWSAQQAVATA
jgi:maleate cis-trans isomerase